MAEAALPARSGWRAIGICAAAGAAAAMQVGKAAAALPLIRAEFGTGVSLLGLYLSLISVVAALAGFGFGVIARRVGTRRAAVTGLACVGLASGAGAFAADAAALLATRVFEAVGFALCTTALPALIRAAATPRRRALAMGIWATWMPLGVAAAMAVSALALEWVGWRGVFVICATVPLAAALAVAGFAPALAPVRPTAHAGHGIREVMRREVFLTTGVFVAFSAGNMIFMGFLPTLLVDEFLFAPAAATLLTMLAVLCLLPTNVGAGHWMDAGAEPRVLLVVSFAVMGAAPIVLMAGGIPEPVRLVAIFITGAAAGVPPAVVWASIPRLSRDSDDAPLLSGLFYQGAGVGQVAGPVAAALAVEHLHGWWSAVLSIALCAAAGIFLAIPLGRPEQQRIHR